MAIRVTQTGIEVWVQNPSKIRVTQIGAEVWRSTSYLVIGAGSASGTGTATAVGQDAPTGAGTAAGTGDATAAGSTQGLAIGVGSAAGTGSANAYPTSATTSAGTATGTGSANAVGSGTTLQSGTGTANGTGTATAVGAATTLQTGVGAAAGTGTATAVGVNANAAVGAASGIGTASAFAAPAGAAAGVGTATAVGLRSRNVAGVGNASGVGTAAATATILAPSVGNAAGIGTANASPLMTVVAVGHANGIGTATAVGQSFVTSTGPPVVTPPPPTGGPVTVSLTQAFFFAWADSTETVFDPNYHRRIDEAVLSLDMEHKEAEFPGIKVEIKNRYQGYLKPGQKVWAWLSWLNPQTQQVQPLFFGRLVAIPDDLFAEVLTLHFMARHVRYLLAKQSVAEGLRVLPYYDPLFVVPEKRDDPDTVLEAYSATYHYDRLTLAITISDILLPEDGYVTVTEQQHWYDGMTLKVGQVPLTNVRVRGTVTWTQQSAGRFYVGQWAVNAWNGESIISDWPKPGAQLAGGYTVSTSFAIAINGALHGSPQSRHFHYENAQTTHLTGDVMTEDASWVEWPCEGQVWTYAYLAQGGVVNPYGIPNLGGAPTGINIPLHVHYDQTMVALWNLSTFLTLDYEANRPRTENIDFTLSGDLQNVYTEPGEPASTDTEILQVTGGDASSPLILPLMWYSYTVAGGGSGYVNQGQFVASTPEFSPQTIYAICIVPGGIGGTEPNWPDITGTLVNDGAAVWAIVGYQLPTTFPIWREVANATVQAGTIIRASFYQAPPTIIPQPPVNGAVQSGVIAQWGILPPQPPAGLLSYQLALTTGVTQVYSNGLNGLADVNPAHPEPSFQSAAGGITQDGGVTWISLGQGLAAGDTMQVPLLNNLAANAYLPTSRGLNSLGYLVNRARAHLLMRSRCVQVSFECRFELAISLSCRMGVILYDHRLPGGSMVGKIVSYRFTGHGDKGELRGYVTIAAAVGTGTPMTPITGQAYTDPGYTSGTFYEEQGGTIVVDPNTSDVGFSTPVASSSNDDGVIFPINSLGQVSLQNRWMTGTTPGPTQTITTQQTIPYVAYNTYQYVTIIQTITLQQGWTYVEIPFDTLMFLPYQTTVQVNTPVFYPLTQYFLELRPLDGISFKTQYNLNCTLLAIPKMIDLAA